MSNGTPYDEDEYAEYLATWKALSGAARSTLHALHYSGPLWDGNVPSKSGRDELLRNRLAAKVIVKGEEGYQACTYLGHRVLRVGVPQLFESSHALAKKAIDAAIGSKE